MTNTARNPWLVLTVLVLGFFMVMLDISIVNIAIPNMIDGLHATLDQVLWVLNGYILVFDVLLITAGRLGDRFGQRNAYAAGVALFVLGSIACGSAQTADQLVAARLLQGAGGALLTPQTLAILVSIFPPERRGVAFSVWGIVGGLASIAGVTVGGVLVTAFGWRWIFLINVPVGVATLVATFWVVPDLRPGREHSFAPVGIVLATAALFCLSFGLIEGERYQWGTVAGFVSIPLILVVAVVLLGVFLVWNARAREPLIPMRLFRDRDFAVMNWVAVTINIGFFGLVLPLTIFLQSAIDYNPIQAGLTLLPMALTTMAVAPFAGRYADRIGGKYLLMAGLVLCATGFLFVALAARPDATWSAFVPGLLVVGAGMGLSIAPQALIAMRNVQPQLAGSASGVLNTVRHFGSILGGTIMGAVLQTWLASGLHEQATRRVGSLPADAQGGFVAGFDAAGRNGLAVGPSTSAAVDVSGLPAAVAEPVLRAAHEVFVLGFLDAMRPTVALGAAILLVGAVSCLAVRRRRAARPVPAPVPERA